jgi:hypothetical protein
MSLHLTAPGRIRLPLEVVPPASPGELTFAQTFVSERYIPVVDTVPWRGVDCERKKLDRRRIAFPGQLHLALVV